MRVFKVPFDIKREEKIFGGYLSLRQVLYLIGAASSLLIAIPPLTLVIKILFIVIIATFFFMCAFLKLSNQNFDKLFFYALKYIFRRKKYLWERSNLW